MTTTYPVTLPPVPVDRWGFDKLGSGGDPENPENPAWVDLLIHAADPGEAERRALAVIAHDYEDDLPGAEANAVEDGAWVRWRVRVTFHHR